MNKKEINDYIERLYDLGTKLTGKDKETYTWLIYSYNKCVKLLNEKEEQCKKQKDNWNYIKKMLKEARQEKYISGYCGTCTDVDIDFLLDKMQEIMGGDK